MPGVSHQGSRVTALVVAGRTRVYPPQEQQKLLAFYEHGAVVVLHVEVVRGDGSGRTTSAGGGRVSSTANSSYKTNLAAANSGTRVKTAPPSAVTVAGMQKFDLWGAGSSGRFVKPVQSVLGVSVLGCYVSCSGRCPFCCLVKSGPLRRFDVALELGVAIDWRTTSMFSGSLGPNPEIG